MSEMANMLDNGKAFWRRWLLPALQDRHVLRSVRLYGRYLRDWHAYVRMSSAEELRFADSYPCLHDRRSTTPHDAHYFYQDVWAFKQVHGAAPAAHVDVGSRAIFAGMLSAFTKVTFVDIRPLPVTLENFESIPGNVVALPFGDDSVRSLSCLHVAEHVGLGRYGDALDPQGTNKAAGELARVLAPGGNLYFSVPVGRPRVCFNAHRILHAQQVMDCFSDLELVSFSCVDDERRFRQNVAPSELAGARFACGLFHFTNPERGPGDNQLRENSHG